MVVPLNIAVVGAGGFAYFATTEFVKIPDVKLMGMYDENAANAFRFKEIETSAKVYTSLEELCADPKIDLVYIATPPYLHYAQSKVALLASKHVICEKPASLKLEHAIELRALAIRKKLLYVVNLMQRYNPLYDAVNKLIRENALGDFLHGFFENYASDESLNEQHWFWDEEKSGGIFIEHGVHFFDMFSGWLGEGKLISSQKTNRLNHRNIWDKVQATVLYSGGTINFYHGFDQPKIMDRQEMRLLFERGEVTLFGWVPTRLKITTLCDENDFQKLTSIFPGAEIEVIENYNSPQVTRGRFKEIKYTRKLKLDTGSAVLKTILYQGLVTNMFKDQLAWIKDDLHNRKIDQDNAVSSLKLAEEAELKAVKIDQSNMAV